MCMIMNTMCRLVDERMNMNVYGAARDEIWSVENEHFESVQDWTLSSK